MIMNKYYQKDLDVEQKPGEEGPVTKADKEADAMICRELAERFPEIPIVSEEGNPKPDVTGKRAYWLVDALDGTKSFVKGGENWTVNIALIVDGKPQFGVVYSPVHGVMYAGDVERKCCYKIKRKSTEVPTLSGEPLITAEQIKTRSIPQEGATVIMSHHHKGEELVKMLPGVKIHKTINASSSIKFCKIAEGSADIYPRSGPTSEWDTAAGQAVLEAAGGAMLDEKGNPFTYGKPGFKNGPFSVYGKSPALGVGTVLMHAGNGKEGLRK